MKQLLESILNVIANISSVSLAISLVLKIWMLETEYDYILNRIIATSIVLLLSSIFFYGMWCYSPEEK